jgi:hypothetical protein
VPSIPSPTELLLADTRCSSEWSSSISGVVLFLVHEGFSDV